MTYVGVTANGLAAYETDLINAFVSSMGIVGFDSSLVTIQFVEDGSGSVSIIWIIEDPSVQSVISSADFQTTLEGTIAQIDGLSQLLGYTCNSFSTIMINKFFNAKFPLLS